MVNRLVNRLKEQEIELHLTEEAISAIADKGFDRSTVLVHFVEQFRNM